MLFVQRQVLPPKAEQPRMRALPRSGVGIDTPLPLRPDRARSSGGLHKTPQNFN